MVQHKDIQDPAKFNESHYNDFETKLKSLETSKIELEEICMTLAHLPTKRAQKILKKFRESERSDEVIWLQSAIEEGQFHYLSPTNEKERKDLIALKMYFKNEDRIVELMVRQSQYEFSLDKMQIELEAVKILTEKTDSESEKKDLEIKEMVLHDLMIMEESYLSETIDDIEMTVRINQQIKQNITTKKYLNLDRNNVMDIVFDGEKL